MILTLTPMRRDEVLTLHRAGETLTIDGIAYDFAPLPEGASLPEGATGCPWIVGPVTREGGRLCLTLILPHGAEASTDALFPMPIVDPPDGPVALPGAAAEDAA